MSWMFVFVLAATAYACKVLGLVVIGDRTLPPVLDRCLALIPAALVAAIVVRDVFSVGTHYAVDRPRLAGVGVAVALSWRRAPLIVVIIAGAATAALLRTL
jgi:branched-subunit amino acid transport protein